MMLRKVFRLMMVSLLSCLMVLGVAVLSPSVPGGGITGTVSSYALPVAHAEDSMSNGVKKHLGDKNAVKTVNGKQVYDVGNTGVLAGIENMFKDVATQGVARLYPHITMLIMLFGVISWCTNWSLYEGQMRLSMIISTIMKVCFFWWLATWWTDIADDIFTSLQNLGLYAVGDQSLVDPKWAEEFTSSSVVNRGFGMISFLWDNLGNGGVAASILKILGMALVLFAHCLIAFQVFITRVEFRIFEVLAFVFLPFGIYGPTSFLFQRCVSGVFAYGAKLMVVMFLMGLCESKLAWGGKTPAEVAGNAGLSASSGPSEYLVVGLTLLLLAYLVMKAGELAQAIASGSPNLSGGGLMGAVRSVGGSAMGVATGGAAMAMIAKQRMLQNAGKAVAEGATQGAGSGSSNPVSAAAGMTGSDSVGGVSGTGGGGGGSSPTGTALGRLRGYMGGGMQPAYGASPGGGGGSFGGGGGGDVGSGQSPVANAAGAGGTGTSSAKPSSASSLSGGGMQPGSPGGDKYESAVGNNLTSHDKATIGANAGNMVRLGGNAIDGSRIQHGGLAMKQRYSGGNDAASVLSVGKLDEISPISSGFSKEPISMPGSDVSSPQGGGQSDSSGKSDVSGNSGSSGMFSTLGSFGARGYLDPRLTTVGSNTAGGGDAPLPGTELATKLGNTLGMEAGSIGSSGDDGSNPAVLNNMGQHDGGKTQSDLEHDDYLKAQKAKEKEQEQYEKKNGLQSMAAAAGVAGAAAMAGQVDNSNTSPYAKAREEQFDSNLREVLKAQNGGMEPTEEQMAQAKAALNKGMSDDAKAEEARVNNQMRADMAAALGYGDVSNAYAAAGNKETDVASQVKESRAKEAAEKAKAEEEQAKDTYAPGKVTNFLNKAKASVNGFGEKMGDQVGSTIDGMKGGAKVFGNEVGAAFNAVPGSQRVAAVAKSASKAGGKAVNAVGKGVEEAKKAMDRPVLASLDKTADGLSKALGKDSSMKDRVAGVGEAAANMVGLAGKGLRGAANSTAGSFAKEFGSLLWTAAKMRNPVTRSYYRQLNKFRNDHIMNAQFKNGSIYDPDSDGWKNMNQ